MAFNFPSGAVPNQQYTTDNGITYVFDGQIWNVVATPASNTLVGNVTIDGGLELTGSISGGYSRIHFVSESSGETGSNLSTIQMVPDINSPSSEQILIIDPTGGYPNHLHLRPGGPMDNSGVSIILGGENSNVSVIGGTNPPIQITSNNYLWQFNTDGTLIFPDYTNQTTAFTGLPIGSVSGSSQLTSSYDERYTLSGSIPNIPTGSFATTGSNTFTGDMTLISSSNIILRGPGDDGISGSGDIIWQDTYGNEMARLWKSADNDRLTVSFTGSHNSYVFGTLIHSLNLKEFGDEHFILTSSFNSYTSSISTGSLVNRLNAIESVSGSWITESETGSFLTSLNGAISSSSQLTSSYDARYLTIGGDSVISGSSQLTSSFDTRYALSASFVSSSNVSSIQTITSASYAALTPVSGTLYIIIG